MTEEIDKTKMTHLRARVVLVNLNMTLLDPCECGLELVNTDQSIAIALESGRTLVVQCPQCARRHTIAKGLVTLGS